MDWYTTEDGKYRIELLSPATIPGALEVIRVAFCEEEAVCVGSEVNKNPKAKEELLELCADAALDGNEIYEEDVVCVVSVVNKNPKAKEELLELCADAALDGASLVAVATDSGEVVAASFNKLQVAVADSSERSFFEVFAAERCTQESARSLIRFMANVDERCNLFQKCGVDCSLEIMFLATFKEHRHRRLGELLCKYSIEVARKLKDGPISTITVKDLGPKYSYMVPRSVTSKYPKICQAIWTGPATMKIGKKLNFTVYLAVSYDEFIYEGRTFSSRIDLEKPFCEVAAIKL